MDASTLQRFRTNLFEKRRAITDWLGTTPVEKRRIHLGPTDGRQVDAYLNGIDTAIEKAEAQTLGVCTVCHDYVNTDLLEMDYNCCICLDHFSPQEMRQLENELELAQTVQRSLLPQHIPDLPGVEIAAFSRPAQILGGDYFDFLLYGDGAPGLAIADVAGHGMSAGLLMASLQTALQTLVPDHDSPAAVVQRINRLYNHNIHVASFVTIFLGRFDFQEQAFTYCNAGHNPPLLLRGGNGVGKEAAWLDPTGAAIGLVEEANFNSKTIPLQPGDLLLFYTDGVTEAMNAHGEQFGPQRLADFVQAAGGSSAKEIVDGVRDQLMAFGNGQPLADDTTILVCKFNPPN